MIITCWAFGNKKICTNSNFRALVDGLGLIEFYIKSKNVKKEEIDLRKNLYLVKNSGLREVQRTGRRINGVFVFTLPVYFCRKVS